MWVMSCYGFKGSVSLRNRPHPRNVHTQSWAPIYFMTRTWEVAFHISALITGHKEKLKEDVELDCWWLIALPSNLSRTLWMWQFSALWWKDVKLGPHTNSLCSQGAFPRQAEIRVGEGGFSFSCVIDSMQATCFISWNTFFKLKKVACFY